MYNPTLKAFAIESKKIPLDDSFLDVIMADRFCSTDSFKFNFLVTFC